MSTIDPRIDTYIVKSAGFAIPILDYLRELVHAACPDVNETMKWSMPFFEYKNYNLCNMASFKQHCAFGFWLGPLLTDPDHLLVSGTEKNSMGQLGRITTIEDLPPAEKLMGLIQEAMGLIDKGVRPQKEPASKEIKELIIPEYLTEAVNASPRASETFGRFSYSQKKEYVEWVTDAKSEATRNKRMEQAIEWMEEGKQRNWKYQK
jgi:uncharacterized protein YdeI (YjbR/CyaY-like superfamily)